MLQKVAESGTSGYPIVEKCAEGLERDFGQFYQESKIR